MSSQNKSLLKNLNNSLASKYSDEPSLIGRGINIEFYKASAAKNNKLSISRLKKLNITI